MMKEMCEIDAVVGIGANNDIVAILDKVMGDEKVQVHPDKLLMPLEGKRLQSTPQHTAYIKISEGCDNRCTYCAIPLIRGGHRSRKMENIIEEAKGLASKGVKELNVIAQDTTRYGMDLYGEYKLAELLKELCKIDGLKWIRVLYCYPDKITDELIDVIKNEDKICKYIDLPLQHCNKDVLRRMNRSGDKDELLALLRKLRKEIPNLVIRTTFIAGFPGETEEEFQKSLDFVHSIKFAKVHTFSYSRRKGTVGDKLPNQVDPQIKSERSKKMIEVTLKDRKEFLRNQLNNTYSVLFERKKEEGYWEGYTMNYTPVRVFSDLDLNDKIVDVKLTDAFDDYCIGELI